jgi:hypothetical protein
MAAIPGPFDRGFNVSPANQGLHLRDLPTPTLLLVWTMNSVYRMVIAEAPAVFLQGGLFFPDWTAARFHGASVSGFLETGWIGVGLPMEIGAAGRRIVTSPVRAITIQVRRPRPRIRSMVQRAAMRVAGWVEEVNRKRTRSVES